MSSSVTTVSVLPPAVREYYDRLLLETAFPQLIFNRFAQRRTLPSKSGDTIVFRRYNKLAPVPVPLVDGVTPPGVPLSTTDIKARVSFYGNFVTLTNQVQLTVEDQVLNESSVLLAQNMAQTIDQLTRDVLASTSSVIQCANGQNGGTPTELSKADIDTAVQTLLGNDADMISAQIDGTNQFGTAPIRPAFWGFSSTDLISSLEAVSGFISEANYPGSIKTIPSEWGSTGNVRWLVTSVASISAAATPVYNNFIVGKEAYGVVNLRSETGDFYVHPLGSAGAADPLNQRGTVGWQLPYVARILNDNFMVNLMSTNI